MNMKINKNSISAVLLLLGLAFLALGFTTDNRNFSWAAVACVLISLLLGGRWLRPRKRP